MSVNFGFSVSRSPLSVSGLRPVVCLDSLPENVVSLVLLRRSAKVFLVEPWFFQRNFSESIFISDRYVGFACEVPCVDFVWSCEVSAVHIFRPVHVPSRVVSVSCVVFPSFEILYLSRPRLGFPFRTF